MKCFFMMLLFSWGIGAFAESSSLELDLERPELAAVKAAATAEARDQALLEYFRKREMPSFHDSAKSELSKRDRETADNALQHRFVGQSAYGPRERGTPIDWDSSPVPDREWLWQFHRFNWLPSLGRAYQITGDPRYAREWAGEINSWVRHMHAEKRFPRHAGWRSLDTAIRMKNWTTTFEYFVTSPALDAATLTAFLQSLLQQAEYIYSLYPADKDPKQLNNWDITQLEALLYFSAGFPEFRKSAEFARCAVDRLGRFQKRVLLPDGVIDEFVPSYHMAYPAQFGRLPDFCRKFQIPAEFPPDYLELVEKSINAVMLWSHPDGTSPMFGDAWQGKPGANRTWIKPYCQMFDRADWLWFATSGKEGAEPAGRAHELPEAGYYMMRSGWDENAVFVVLKNTHMTEARWHNHNDNLSFELSAFGRRLMADSGCYNYSGEPEWRRWFRRPQAHQMVTLDDLPVASRGRKILQQSLPGLDVTILENVANAGFTHRRSVYLVEGKYLLVLDELSGKAGGILRQHFQFVPGPWVLDRSRLTARTLFSKGPNLVVKGWNAPGVSVEEEEGWISPRYMEKEPRPAFAFIRGKRPGEKQVFLTLLLPLPAERQISEVELGFLNDGRHSDTPGDTVYFRLNHREFFRIRLFSDQRKTPELATFKASWSPQEEERVLLENGHWERPPLPELPE